MREGGVKEEALGDSSANEGKEGRTEGQKGGTEAGREEGREGGRREEGGGRKIGQP